jgi:hypothetical protein
MAKKTKELITATVLDVISVTVDAESVEPAAIAFEMEGAANVELRLSSAVLVKLEAMLAAVSVEQAKHNPVQ